MTDTLTITVIEPEELAPVGRLGEWLFAEGAALRMVRPWRGDPIPSLSEVGDGLVVLGGSMSAHDEADHPWLADLRELLRGVVADDVPAIALCLGAQGAAPALLPAGVDPELTRLGLDVVGPRGRDLPALAAAASTSFGFGGHNVALVFTRE